jgi:hypothetical protein
LQATKSHALGFTNDKITADKTKTSALTKERDAVVRAADGEVPGDE